MKPSGSKPFSSKSGASSSDEKISFPSLNLVKATLHCLKTSCLIMSMSWYKDSLVFLFCCMKCKKINACSSWFLKNDNYLMHSVMNMLRLNNVGRTAALLRPENLYTVFLGILLEFRSSNNFLNVS